MDNYNQVRKYLDSFINYERKVFFQYKKNLKLKRVKFLLSSLNINYKDLKAFHIAGTKGKGSTAIYCANILAKSGFTVGLYTSPHFFDFRERIQILEKDKKYFIPKKDVIRIVNEIKPMLEKIRFTKKFGKLSFFEVYTAIGFKYFIEKKVDFVVLETGLGGRLDATNVVLPLVSIITHIGYDHMDKLGYTLKEIAYEKAGIIKKNTPTVSTIQSKDALRVLKEKCREKKSKFFLLNRDFFIENIRMKKDFSIFDFRFNGYCLKDLKIFMKGKAQIENASLAVMSILIIKDRFSFDFNIKDGLMESFIEGRFEVFKKDPLIILDVAHNPSSFSVLSENIEFYYPNKKIILIFAASKDKDVKNMLNKINAQKIILTTFSNPRSIPPEEILKNIKLNTIVEKDLKKAIELAKKIYKKNNLILISGSLFLVSDAKRYLQN